MIFTEQIFLLMIVVATVLYVVYSCYLIAKQKKDLNEKQERRISTLMLLVIFFSLSMIYQYYAHSCIFLVAWFAYAMWLIIKDTRKTIGGGSKCFLC